MVFRSRRFKPYHCKAPRVPTAASLISKLDTAGLRSVIEPVMDADHKLVARLLDDARKTPFDGVTDESLRDITTTLVTKRRILNEDLQRALDTPREASRSPRRRAVVEFEKQKQSIYGTVMHCAMSKMCTGIVRRYLSGLCIL